ncbi:MAG: hypothetical protein RL757_586 [Bacteroidota bacterium]|jgi:hypothetical protein
MKNKCKSIEKNAPPQYLTVFEPHFQEKEKRHSLKNA